MSTLLWSFQVSKTEAFGNSADFIFKNSKTLINSHSKLLETLDSNVFYGFSRGIYESNMVISSSEKQKIQNYFKGEIMIGLHENLSAISIRLPENKTKRSGLYYQKFKRFAWEGISLYEVISSTNEFSVLVEDHNVEKAFSAIKKLNN